MNDAAVQVPADRWQVRLAVILFCLALGLAFEEPLLQGVGF